jgi:prepilin-type processing-associated H-X9-DG protein
MSSAWPGWISNALRPYEKSPQIYYCPSRSWTGEFVDPRLNPTVNQSYTPSYGVNPPGVVRGQGRKVTYTYNENGMGHQCATSVRGRSEAAFHEPAQLAIMWDSATPWTDCWFSTSTCSIWHNRDICWYFGRLPGMSNCGGQNLNNTSWHNGGNNFLYYDGHVKWARWENMKWHNMMNVGQGNADYNKPVNVAPVTPCCP